VQRSPHLGLRLRPVFGRNRVRLMRAFTSTTTPYSLDAAPCRADGHCPSSLLWVTRRMQILLLCLPTCRDGRHCRSNPPQEPLHL